MTRSAIAIYILRDWGSGVRSPMLLTYISSLTPLQLDEALRVAKDVAAVFGCATWLASLEDPTGGFLRRQERAS